MSRFLFFIFLFVVVNLHSQNALRDDLNGVYYNPSLYKQQYEVENGSPYLDLEFQPAKIGDREKTYMVRFNGYKGNIEVWVKENQVIVLDTPREEPIKLLNGSDKDYVILKYKDSKGKIEQGFLEVIASTDSYTLFKKEIINYFKKTKAEGYAPAKPARFEKANPQFYLKPSKDEIPIYLSKNKKKFLAVFGPKMASKAKTTLKKQRLNLSDKDDLIKILDAIYN